MTHRATIGVVLTRPAGRGRALARVLELRGFAVAALPGSAIGPSPDAVGARAALRAGRRADVVIFLSPAAVASAFRLAPQFAVGRRCTVLAPGPGTVAALRRRGLDASCPAERYDSEGLLAMTVLREVAGRRVALVGAPGGRDLLARTLRARGASVETIHVYERRSARLDRRHVERLAALPPTRVSVWSSADAVTHLTAALPPASLDPLCRAPAIASSERVAAALRERGFGRIALAASARPADLLAAIDAFAARHGKATDGAATRRQAHPTIR